MNSMGSKDAGGTLLGNDAPEAERFPSLYLDCDEIDALGARDMTIGQEFEMRAKVRVASISMQTGGEMCMTLEFMAAEVKDDAAVNETAAMAARAYPSMAKN